MLRMRARAENGVIHNHLPGGAQWSEILHSVQDEPQIMYAKLLKGYETDSKPFDLKLMASESYFFY